jgi:hypothetical protein
MSDPKMILDIMSTVTIPVMAKVRISFFAEAQIIQFIKAGGIADVQGGISLRILMDESVSFTLISFK